MNTEQKLRKVLEKFIKEWKGCGQLPDTSCSVEALGKIFDEAEQALAEQGQPNQSESDALWSAIKEWQAMCEAQQSDWMSQTDFIWSRAVQFARSEANRANPQPAPASAVNEQMLEALTLASWALTRENINVELVKRKVSAAITAAKAVKGE